MKSVLALDQGTTGSTALVVSKEGQVVGRAYREFTQHFPRPGWVEHDAEEIWRVTIEAATEAMEQAGTRPSAIGITNQRETVVVWDRATGKPLHRAIVWQDRRTAARCRSLRDELGGPWVASRTGLVWDPYFSATKIEWLLHHVGDLAARARDGAACFGTIDAWLIHKLTGGTSFATDHTNASRTLLYNIRDQAWDEELLDLFDVPVVSLPEVVGSSGEIGVAAGEHFGFDLPIAGVAGDQQAALYGQTCWASGEAKCTYGTGAFLLMNVGPDVPDTADSGVLATVACDANGRPAYALEGSIFIAGAAVQWLRDGLGIIQAAEETEDLARGLPENDGVYFVPALVGLGAPHWEAEARGTLVGITRGTTSAHLVRAALEAMAYSTKDVADAMAAVSGVGLKALKADGGAAANDWLMQFQSDTLGVPVSRPDVVETTALGAAGLAGLAVGVWSTPQEFAASRTYRAFEPRTMDPRHYEGWRRALRAALHWARDEHPA